MSETSSLNGRMRSTIKSELLMGRNTPLGTQVVNMSKWDSHQPFREQVKVVKKRGPKKGSYQRPDFTTDPRTPFEALRCLLRSSRPEWGLLRSIAGRDPDHSSEGEMIASVPLAKENDRRSECAVLPSLSINSTSTS